MAIVEVYDYCKVIRWILLVLGGLCLLGPGVMMLGLFLSRHPIDMEIDGASFTSTTSVKISWPPIIVMAVIGVVLIFLALRIHPQKPA